MTTGEYDKSITESGIWFKKFFTENNCFKYNQPWKYKGRSCTGYW